MGNSIPTIAIGFDGVIHSNLSGSDTTIPDPPVKGAFDFLAYLASDGTAANAVICSSRAKTWSGRRAIRAWLQEHAGDLWYEGTGTQGIESIPVTSRKPVAAVYLDDRAERFEGVFPKGHEDVKAMVNRLPWNKSGPIDPK